MTAVSPAGASPDGAGPDVTDPAPSWVGRSLELDIGPVAHGGHCVARSGGEHGRVVFVRHTLPGERVRAVVTEDAGGSFCRADAVEVLDASAHRVRPPCPAAGPGRCGGCDWQHASPDEQRRLKAAVVREQFARLAGLDVDVAVAALPGGSLGWRTRIGFAVGADGWAGLHRHRSHDVLPLDRCPLGTAAVGDAPELAERWSGRSGLDITVGADGARSVATRRPIPARRRPGRGGRGTRPVQRREQVSGPTRVSYDAAGRRFRVGTDGFWQVHPAAGDALAALVRELADPRPGETVHDLYAGAGLFTAILADAVGPAGTVRGLEQDAAAVTDAAANLVGLPHADVRRGRVDAGSVAALAGPPDVVVLDPPRAGAGAAVMRALCAAPTRAVVYVACDPAALARDVRTALDAGWRLADLRALDAFPMTHHVECVALLVPEASAVGSQM